MLGDFYNALHQADFDVVVHPCYFKLGKSLELTRCQNVKKKVIYIF